MASSSTSHSQEDHLQSQPQQPWTSASAVPPSSTGLTPYLTLPHHLSLTWLATPILSLLFIVFRLLMSMTDAQDASNDAKRALMSSCNAAQTASGAVINIPRFMAESVNAGVEKAVNDSIDAARATMIFSLSALQGIIEFIIDIYRSTLLCFIELAIRATLGVLIQASESFNAFVNSSLSAVRTNIQNDIGAANSAIQGAAAAINKILPSFIPQISVPQFDIPSLSGLQNVVLPTTIQDGLTTLNSTIPTMDDIRNGLDQLIDVPFNALKAEINGSFTGMRFDATVLPVPQAQQLAFCDSMDTSVVDDLVYDLVKIAKIGCFLLLAVAVLMILGNCFIQWYRWRSLQWTLQCVREAEPSTFNAGGTQYMEMSDRNLLSMSSSIENPLATAFATRIGQLLRLNSQKTINIRFFFNYIFYPPALACFLIGFFGLLSVQIQLAAIAPIQQHYASRVAGQVNQFSVSIADSVNGNMQAQSTAYATSVNAQIDGLQTSVNQGVFGWVNGTIVPLNNTLEAFYTDIQNTVTKVFGGTILEAPMQEFIRCLIGTKVQALENAFTFVQENFQVNIRPVDPNVLMLSDASMQAATTPIAAAAIGGSDGDDSGGIVGKLVKRYVAALEKERLMFLVFLGLWMIVVLMAIVIIFWHSYGRTGIFGWKKRRHLNKTRELVGGEGVITPWIASESFHQPSTKEEELDEKVDEWSSSGHQHQYPYQPPVLRQQQSLTKLTEAPRKSKISLPVSTFSNIRPSSKASEEALAPPPAPARREVIRLDTPPLSFHERQDSNSSVEANVTTPLNPKKRRQSRKLTNENRRPVRETLVPDSNGPAVNFVRRGSNDDTSSNEAPPTSDGGFLLKLGGMFGKKSSDEEAGSAVTPSTDERPNMFRDESFGRQVIDPHLLAPQPRRVELVQGEQRKSVRVAGPPASMLPPPPPPPGLAAPRRVPPPFQPQQAPPPPRGMGVPIHHHFVLDPRGSRVIPKMPAPLAPPPPPQPQQQQQHRRTGSEIQRQLYPPAPGSRKSTMIDPTLVNMNLAGIGSRGGAPKLSTLPAPRPMTNPFDDDHRTKSGQWAAPVAPAHNPFASPVATAF